MTIPNKCGNTCIPVILMYCDVLYSSDSDVKTRAIGFSMKNSCKW